MVGRHTGWRLRWGSRKDRRAGTGAGYGPLVPVEFLTDEQAEAYGKFAEEPTRPELERFFFLDDVDRDLIALRRSTHHQLGFALQMCTVRYIGRFLPDDPLDAPWPVVEHLAAQLGIEDPSVVKRYTERPKTAYEHAWEIRDAYEYHEYEDWEWSRRFRTFLHGRAWTHAEGPKALFNQAVGWLRRNRVLLPGVSVPARQVSEVRTVADKRLHATVAGAARRVDAALIAALARDHRGSRGAIRTAVADLLPDHTAAEEEAPALELLVTLDMPGKVADFLRTAELEAAERAALAQGVVVRRGQGYTLRVTVVPAVHCRLLALCQPLDGGQGVPAVPAQRKARREYENRVSALVPTEP